MRTHACVVLSSLLFVGIAICVKGIDSESQELVGSNASRLSAQAKQNCDPHRGSGRKDDCFLGTVTPSQAVSSDI